MGTYEDGAALGCPDCLAGEEHCCPFLWAAQQPEPKRAWALRHMRRHLADEIAAVLEVAGALRDRPPSRREAA